MKGGFMTNEQIDRGQGTVRSIVSANGNVSGHVRLKASHLIDVLETMRPENELEGMVDGKPKEATDVVKRLENLLYTKEFNTKEELQKDLKAMFDDMLIRVWLPQSAEYTEANITGLTAHKLARKVMEYIMSRLDDAPEEKPETCDGCDFKALEKKYKHVKFLLSELSNVKKPKKYCECGRPTIMSIGPDRLCVKCELEVKERLKDNLIVNVWKRYQEPEHKNNFVDKHRDMEKAIEVYMEQRKNNG